MTLNTRIQIILASVAVLATAVAAEVLAPRQLLASMSAPTDLESAIPLQFGSWTAVRNTSMVEPDPEGYVEPDINSSQIYSQEVGRSYADGRGHIVMLLVAYGPVQNFRLKAHRPEMCYTAAGFRISNKFVDTVSYRADASPIRLTRLTAEREMRLEPVSYWMRVGDDVATGVIDRQIIRLKYGLRGIIPDGALIRVSTIGLQAEPAFQLQDEFIRDFLAAVPPRDLRFFTGASEYSRTAESIIQPRAAAEMALR